MSRTRFAVPIFLALALTAGEAAAQPSAQSEQTPPPAPTKPAEPGATDQKEMADAFGQPVTLPARTIVYFKGHANWGVAFDSLVDAFKALHDYLDKQGIKPTGLALTIYTQTDDTGFQFEAALPIAEAPKDPPKGDIAVGPAPSGKALKFVHRGSYDAMDSTYEAITNYLDDKQLEAADLFIEEYLTDPVAANADKLVVNVFVPLK